PPLPEFFVSDCVFPISALFRPIAGEVADVPLRVFSGAVPIDERFAVFPEELIPGSVTATRSRDVFSFL
ncbi:MAG: hypothetical protein ACK58T_29180, partial [Phycisphaerae bacterium]